MINDTIANSRKNKYTIFLKFFRSSV